MSNKPAPDPLQEALANILRKSTDAVEAGVNFLSAQLPDVVHQLLMWHAVRSSLEFVMCLIVAIVLGLVSKKLYRLAKEDSDGFLQGLGCVFTGVGSIAFSLIAVNSLTWLQILIAPKVYLIEYAARLLK